MEQRVDEIILGVADLRRARDFYEALGWHRSGDAVSFGTGGPTVVLRD